MNAAAKDPSRRDNCYKEFSYAQNSGRLFLPVVFEPRMSDPEGWPCGIVKMHCAGKMFVDGSLLPIEDVCDEMLRVVDRLRRMSSGGGDPPPRPPPRPPRPPPILSARHRLAPQLS